MTRRFLHVPEQYPGKTIVAVGLLFLMAYSVAAALVPRRGGRLVVGDAVHYYVYLRSAVFDRDLQFRNEYVRLYGLRGGEEDTEWVYQPTATGHVRNLMSIGPAIVWAPLFVLATAGVAAARALGSTYAMDGYGVLFQASAGLGGILAATLGAWLAWRLCRRFFDARIAIWATLAVWLGSSAVYYSVISPIYSHASSMLVSSLFFYAWGTSLGRQTPARYGLVGVLAGLTMLVRWQDAVFLVVPFSDAVLHAFAGAPSPGEAARGGSPSGLQPESSETGRRPGWRQLVINLAACGAGALLAFSPQMLVWMVLFGRPFVVPQGGEFMQWGAPHLFSVLFSDWRGLFTWTPVLALSAVGLVPLWRRQRSLAIGMIAALILSWYANAAVIDWWAGEAYGARRFVSCFPIFVVGLAALADRFRASLSRLVTLAVVFVSLNFLLLLQYQLFMHGWRALAPYPRGFYGLVVARFVVPFRLIAWLWGD